MTSPWFWAPVGFFRCPAFDAYILAPAKTL